MEVRFSQRIRERYQTIKLGVVVLGSVKNSGSRKLRSERKSVEKLIKKQYARYPNLRTIKAYRKYFGRFDKEFPLEEGLKAVLEGRGIPTWSPVVDAMLLAELKHTVLLGVMDTDRIDGPVTLDEAQEGEEFMKLNGESVFLNQGDVVLRDRKGIMGTYLEGQSDRTKVNSATRNCAYFGFYVPGIQDSDIKSALKDAVKFARLACGGETLDIEIHIPREGKVVTAPAAPLETIKVTPWEVSGKLETIDYDRLIKEFGTQKLTEDLIKRLEKHTGPRHMLLRRGLFFSHRDMDWLLNEYEKGNRFYLYTGRGPSGHTHLGHLVPWIFTKWLQDKFGVELWFQMTDDEKFLFKEKLTVEQANKFAYENALDVIALGFDPKKTFIFSDIDYAKTLYREAIKVAKKLTFSTAKAVFGFTHESNVGQIFFTSMQSVPAFLPSLKKKKNIPCLIPYAIDQDPHFRVCRDIMPRLGFHKPAAIHNTFLPGLGRGGKMSASDPMSAIFTTDTPEAVRKKVMNAFTGGQGNAAEQRKLGGNPDICPLYQYEYTMFEPDDRKVQKICDDCRSGKLLCGEHKKSLAEKIVKFLKNHQKARERAKKHLEKFILKD